MNDRRRHSAEKASHAVSMGTAKAVARLYLVTPPLGETGAIADALAQALNAADIAAVLLRLEDADDRALMERVRALRVLIQSNGAALLLDGHAALAAQTEADGAHLTGIEVFKAAAPALKPARIAGCGGLTTRHDAMVAAESGADYVMFGEPDRDGRRPGFEAVCERVAWSADVFTVPCVGYAATLDEVEALARAGADFVAIAPEVWLGTHGGAAAITAVSERLAIAEPAQ
jgi:thiamine-phosphate pyrophosphorylase